MTELKTADYVRLGGGFCPVCGCMEIVLDGVNFNGLTITAGHECRECGTMWTDKFKIESISIDRMKRIMWRNIEQ